MVFCKQLHATYIYMYTFNTVFKREIAVTLTFASAAFSGGPYLEKTALSATQNLSTKDLRDLLIGIFQTIIC